MKKTRILAIILCIAMIAASVMALYSCGDDKTLGSGATSIKVDITKDGKTTSYTVKTDEKNLGAALTHKDVKLIEVKSSDYGNYVTSVDGTENTDDTFWMIYVDGKVSEVGIDDIEIVKDAKYEFKFEKWED